jgi:hypothetical protein
MNGFQLCSICLMFISTPISAMNIDLPYDVNSPKSENECNLLSKEYSDLISDISSKIQITYNKGSAVSSAILKKCGGGSGTLKCSNKRRKATEKYFSKARRLSELRDKIYEEKYQAMRRCKLALKDFKEKKAEANSRYLNFMKVNASYRNNVISKTERLNQDIAKTSLIRTAKNASYASVPYILSKDNNVYSYFKHMKRAQKTLSAIQLLNNIFNGGNSNSSLHSLINNYISNSGQNSLIKGIMRTSFDNVFLLRNHTIDNLDTLVKQIQGFDPTVNESRNAFNRLFVARVNDVNSSYDRASKENDIAHLNNSLTNGKISRNTIALLKEEKMAREERRYSEQQRRQREAREARERRQYEREMAERDEEDDDEDEDDDGSSSGSGSRGNAIVKGVFGALETYLKNSNRRSSSSVQRCKDGSIRGPGNMCQAN